MTEENKENNPDVENDFFNLEEDLKIETLPVNITTPGEEEEEEQTDFENVEIEAEEETADFSEEIEEEIEEEEEENRPNFFNAENLAKLLTNGHDLALPFLFGKIYKLTNFKASEWKEIEEILKNEREHLEKNKTYVLTSEEITLKKRYNTYLDFKENKAPLDDEQKDMLQEALAYQLNKMGVSNVNLGINPLLQAYGMISIDKGVDIAKDKITIK